MATTKTTTKKNKMEDAVSTGSSKQPTAAEMRAWYEKNKKNIELFERSQNALQLLDPNASSAKTFTVFSKELLRTYMENPLSNYKNLRNLSRFLYYRSQPYKRLLQYFAGMINLQYRSVIPNMDFKKGFDIKKDLQSFYDTLNLIDKWPLTTEFYKLLITAWREDAAFGCAYFGEGDNEGDMFILQLPADQCKITGLYSNGDLAFDFDMSYFGNRQDVLEMWGEPFVSMYKEYQKDTRNGKWQPMPDDRAVCLKVNLDTPEDILIPFMGMFDSLIALEDLVEISAIADKQDIYKLIAVTMPLLKNSTNVDDFAVDPNTAIKYYNQAVDKLDDYTNAILLPGLELQEVSFNENSRVNDISKVELTSRAVMNNAGGGQVLNNAKISGTTGLNLAMKSDETIALKPLLGEIEAIVNRLLSFQVKKAAKVKFLEVTKYTVEEKKASLIKSMNYGAPFVFTLGALEGYSEKDMLSMANLSDALDIQSLFKPMATAATRSASEPEGGRPNSEESGEELTDDGEASRDKRETSNS